MAQSSGQSGQVKRCCEVHGRMEGCPQLIPLDNPWQFCPLCGRATGHLRYGEADKRNELNVLPGQNTAVPITLQNDGLTPIKVTIGLKSRFSLRLGNRQFPELTLDRGMRKQVFIDIPPLTQDEPHLGTLKVFVDDNPLDAETDPWDDQSSRTREVDFGLSATLKTEAKIRMVEGAAIFRDGIKERIVHLRNEGKSAARIADILPPPGYDRVEPLDLEEGDSIGGESEKEYRVRRAANTTPRPLDLLIFRTVDGKDATVDLVYLPSSEGGVRTLAVVGIDFGTTGTTVAFRECRPNSKLDDDAVFLPPPGEFADENRNRFPTLIWVGQDGRLEYGEQAEKQFEADPSPDAGFLFSQIKTGLRNVNEIRIDASEHRERAIRRVTELFGENWCEVLISEYLRWLYEYCIKPELKARYGGGRLRSVRYVFSLPVLDYGSPIAGMEELGLDPHPQYTLQSESMKRCVIQAGFPLTDSPETNQVDFEFEPVCASLGLLHPPDDAKQEWPFSEDGERTLEKGKKIAVFDSGGGTTDVILAEVDQDESSGKFMLPFKGCLGVGSEGESFGGEWITDQIAMTIGTGVPSQNFRKTLPPHNKNLPSVDWFTGVAEFGSLYRAIYASNHTFVPELREDWKRAAKLKFKLASGQEEKVPTSIGDSSIKPVLIMLLCLGKLKSLNRELSERVFEPLQRARTDYYLFVGGNTRLSAFQKWTQDIMGDKLGSKRLVLPEKYMQTAVAYGAVWVPDARIHNAAPYDVAVKLVYKNKARPLLEQARHQSQNKPPESEMFEIAANQTLTVEVQAAWMEEFHCVAAASIYSGDEPRNVLIQAEMQYGKIHVGFRDIGGDDGQASKEMQPLLTYAL